MGKYIGIDLGTTFSAAAYIDADGNPQIISNQEGDWITASAVYFEDGRAIVGREAKKESVLDAKHFVAFAKRDMGNSHVRYQIDGKGYRPEEISSIVLQKIKQDVEAALGEEILGGGHYRAGLFYGCAAPGNQGCGKDGGYPGAGDDQ